VNRLIASMSAAGLIVLGSEAGYGQEFPTKTIRMVTSDPGGTSDLMVRLIAQGITGPLGQPVIVENRGGGVVPGETVARAAPDGYTLLLQSSTLWVGPLLQSNVPYDAVRNFAPITSAAGQSNLLVIHPTLPVKSVKELVALAKARPGWLNYSSGASGGPPHLAAELFKAMAHVNIVKISYKATGPAVNGLVSGETQLMFPTSASVASYIKAGRLKALAVATTQPSALFPGLPTVASGLPGYEAVTITGIFAPAKTPSPIISRLSQEMVRFLTRPEVKERFLTFGTEVIASSPEQLATAMKTEIAKWTKVIEEAGIKAD